MQQAQFQQQAEVQQHTQVQQAQNHQAQVQQHAQVQQPSVYQAQPQQAQIHPAQGMYKNFVIRQLISCLRIFTNSSNMRKS